MTNRTKNKNEMKHTNVKIPLPVTRLSVEFVLLIVVGLAEHFQWEGSLFVCNVHVQIIVASILFELSLAMSSGFNNGFRNSQSIH